MWSFFNICEKVRSTSDAQTAIQDTKQKGKQIAKQSPTFVEKYTKHKYPDTKNTVVDVSISEEMASFHPIPTECLRGHAHFDFILVLVFLS